MHPRALQHFDTSRTFWGVGKLNVGTFALRLFLWKVLWGIKVASKQILVGLQGGSRGLKDGLEVDLLNSILFSSILLSSILLGSILLSSILLNSILLSSILLSSILLNSILLNSILLNSILLNSILFNSICLNSVLLSSVLRMWMFSLRFD